MQLFSTRLEQWILDNVVGQHAHPLTQHAFLCTLEMAKLHEKEQALAAAKKDLDTATENMYDNTTEETTTESEEQTENGHRN